MLFREIDCINENGLLLCARDVRVKNEYICEIGTGLACEANEEQYDGRGKLLTPAFFNAHAHAPMTLLRGWGEGLALQDWLHTRIFPFEKKLTGTDVYWGTLLAIAEMLRTGTVASTEMYFYCEDMVKAALEAGVKMNLSAGIVCFDNSDVHTLPFFQETERVLAYHQAEGGRLKIDAGLHAEYTTTPKVAVQMAEYAARNGLRLHLHLAETESEVTECIARHGKTPAQYFYDLGVFDVPTTAAHGVWLQEHEAVLLAEKDVTVATCPVSNLKLASGFCAVQKLLKAGVRVALGTDGSASNNGLNMVADRKQMALLPKGVSHNALSITPQQAVFASTAAGALAQGRVDSGVLRVGARADLVVWRCDEPWWAPGHDRVSDWIYAAQGSDVCLTMCDGRVLYRNGTYTTLDIERVKYEVRAAAQRIAAQL